uniref:Uncharacterized protein MANES_17G040900 n=1 Tax=Rhizophora mucronata TaxID=61149 RepID=A0A2P2IWB3_RHIMU
MPSDFWKGTSDSVWQESSPRGQDTGVDPSMWRPNSSFLSALRISSFDSSDPIESSDSTRACLSSAILCFRSSSNKAVDPGYCCCKSSYFALHTWN